VSRGGDTIVNPDPGAVRRALDRPLRPFTIVAPFTPGRRRVADTTLASDPRCS
jgi:hypothetical protein